MGCGGSKEESTKPYHGHSTGPRQSKKSGEESDTISELSTRPVAPSRAGHAQPPTRPAPVQVSKPKQPDGRVNSANPKTSFQYVSPRGNLPVKRVENIVAKSPPPPHQPLRGKFPKQYRNTEGPPNNRTHNSSDWEIRQQQDPADHRSTEAYEYPVKTLVPEKPASTSESDFSKKPVGLRTVNAVIRPNDRELYEERWNRPPNDPGPIRAVVNKDHQLVGAIYHPEGDTSAYKRARLEPLDGKGRGEVARYDDQQQTGRTTWPQRGPDGGHGVL
ncbi:hypothetical protein F5144DRAFT_491395 [Chaetomium tenue]|uniref:Uncharacterized protein n=1 Tax=Chaetomium tenue TaxID=1854479 RepID=A0ACB7P9T6_9PEZI|nr:hypothetical protein F5144DRAFT_491395 [Chaetomium globosum]